MQRGLVLTNGQAQPLTVTVGDSDGQHRMVTEGLTESDAVVLRPPPGLVAGQRVKAETAEGK